MSRPVPRAAAAAVLVLSCAGPAAAQDSVYTSIEKCPKARLALPGRDLGDDIVRCKGAGGYSVFIVRADVRSWFVLEKGKAKHTLEQAMAWRFEPGHFPMAEAAKVIEWRVDARRAPYALIARIAYQDRDDPDKKGSVLAVFDLTAASPRFLGYHKSNEAARQAADRARPAP